MATELKKQWFRNKPDARLVAYWRFEGNSNDDFGLINGTDTSITYNTSNGLFGQGGGWTTTSSRVSLGDPASLKFSGAHSLSIWINMGGVSRASLDQLFFKGVDGTDFGSIVFYWSNSNTLVYGINPNRANNSRVECSGTVTVDSLWHHACAVYTGSNMYIYWDGKQIATTATSTTIDTTDPWYIGNTNSIRSVNKSLDDAAIFSGALTAQEVVQIYETRSYGEFMPGANTKLLLHLNGSSLDSSGNNNHGTNTNVSFGLNNGMLGQGANFVRASSSIIDCGYNSSLSPGTSDFTVVSWVKFSTYAQYQGLITSRGGSVGYGISMLNTGAPEFFMGNGSTGNQFASSIAITDNGRWHCVVMTRIGTSAYGYVDGAYAGTLNFGSVYNVTVSSTNPVILGRYYANTADGNNLSGNLDETFIEIGSGWSAEKIKKYYTYAKGRFDAK